MPAGGRWPRSRSTRAARMPRWRSASRRGAGSFGGPERPRPPLRLTQYCDNFVQRKRFVGGQGKGRRSAAADVSGSSEMESGGSRDNPFRISSSAFLRNVKGDPPPTPGVPMVERPRGTNDWGPEDMAKRRFVESRFIQLAESFGFREVSTPTFESLELFTAKSGPGIVKELYAFKDQGGRDLALRPEFTASILRFYVSSLRSRPKPLKLYTSGNAFRYEEPQRGRYREFSQLNAEIIGGAALPSDAEALALAIGTMRAIGLKQVKARIGNIGILRSYLPFPPADQGVVLHSLDKRNFPMLEAELAQLGRKDLASPLRKVIELSGDASVLDDAAKILGATAKEGLAYLRDLAGLLDDYGIRRSDYAFDMGVVRGLDYYTGMVFEIDSPNLGAEKQVGGGGAYRLAGRWPPARNGRSPSPTSSTRSGMSDSPELLDPRHPVRELGEFLRDLLTGRQ